MEMEDHHHQHHDGHQQQYGMATDLRQLVNGVRSTHFPSMLPAEEFFPGHHRNLTALLSGSSNPQQQHYEMMMLGREVIMSPRGGCGGGGGVVLEDYAAGGGAGGSTVATAAAPATTTSTSTPDTAGCIGGDASTGRWPRQETLTLLEIRSRLDPKFKEANQKGPLWDEVSRIMCEEHGYQRSGKKCREKFENLYKYYKKTKEGKAGRHDGKHYRFFRQLEALYGDNSNQTSLPVITNFHFKTTTHNHQGPSSSQDMFNVKHSDHDHSLSLTNSTHFDTSSSEGNESVEEKRRRKRKTGRSWKVKIKDFIDSQMKKLVEKQEEWLDKLVNTLEEKEKERMLREEEWRKQEATRLEREHKFWAKERAWIEARDAALMETLHNIGGPRRDQMKDEADHDEGVNVMAAAAAAAHEFQNQNIEEDGSESWQEAEISRLQQLTNEIEMRFPQSEEVTWEEVANKMACFGYERTALMCKKKWESISNYPRDSKEVGNKKQKEKYSSSSRTCFYFNNNDHQSSIYSQYCDVNGQRREIGKLQRSDGSSPSNSNVAAAPGDTCFPFSMSEGGNLWENFGLKINKANQNH